MGMCLKPFNCRFCGETNEEKFVKRTRERRCKTTCKACHSKRTSARMRTNRAILVAEHGGKCVRCGYDKYIGSLHFHHIDPSQKDPKWSTIHTWHIDKARKEAEKCILVCANCHGEIHGMGESYNGIISRLHREDWGSIPHLSTNIWGQHMLHSSTKVLSAGNAA